MTEVRHVSDLLPAVVNGSADAADRAAVEAHLPGCPACAAELEAWQGLVTAVREPGMPAPDTATVLDAVWRQLDTSQTGDTAPARRRWSSAALWRPAWSAAAVLVLVLAFVVVERDRQTPQDVLLAAAMRTTQLETAALRVSGTARFTLETAREPDTSPDEAGPLAFKADVTGRGAVRFGEALHVRLRLDADSPTLGGTGHSEAIERLIVNGHRYERGDDGTWTPLRDSTGLVGLALLDPRFPELVLRHAQGPVQVHDTVERLHGTEVRRYAFDLAADALPHPPGSALRYRAEVWLGEHDGLLHAVRIHATGPVSVPVAAIWDVDLRVDLVDIGEPVAIPSPDTAGQG